MRQKQCRKKKIKNKISTQPKNKKKTLLLFKGTGKDNSIVVDGNNVGHCFFIRGFIILHQTTIELPMLSRDTLMATIEQQQVVHLTLTMQ